MIVRSQLLYYFSLLFLVGCAPIPVPAEKISPSETQISPTLTSTAGVSPGGTIADTAIPSATPTPAVVAAPSINPLTGLAPEDPAILNRRPVIVKVENLPRDHRPQYGLSFADIVYEYHTEEGTTRYAGIFYGRNTDKVGPIRSGRWFDINLIRMYKPIFIFGSAYADLLHALFNADFSKQLILEGPGTSTVLQRYDPNGKNLLLANLNRLPEVISNYQIDNAPQNLDGMVFGAAPSGHGQTASQIFVRYSGAIYNHWDYDPATGRYNRFVDAEDDINRNHEVYTAMLDQQTGKQIAADNVVLILARNFVLTPNVYNIDLNGKGDAYLARNGQIVKAKWTRASETSVLTLVDEQENPVPFKPGTTWFEILSLPTPIIQPGEGIWRFSFIMPE